jgi:tetratricopeptide (TPR) repeat protein
MNQDLAHQAIGKALSGKWEEARDINLTIIKQNPHDIDSLNRLAKAYFELGNIKNAKATISKILKIDPYNPIAVKCFEKWKTLKKVDKNTSKQLSPDMFLEEPGKTKIIHLIHTCDKPIIAKLNCGEIVYSSAKSHRISIVSDSGDYIGKLPDDVSIKIKKLIKLGYQYVFAIKSIDNHGVKVFIREICRPDKYSNKSSFSSERIDYISYTPPELVRDKTESSPTSSFEEETDSTSVKTDESTVEQEESGSET